MKKPPEGGLLTIYLRIPDQLKKQLDAAALENRRSLTAEVAARLEASFQPNIRWAPGGGPQERHLRELSTENFDELVTAVSRRIFDIADRANAEPLPKKKPAKR